MRVCIDCPRLIPAGTRCTDCQRSRTSAIAQQTWEPGERAKHRALRTRYKRRMNAGEQFTCWRCDKPIDPTRWDLGHDDWDRSIHHGPECQSCNRSAAGQKRQARTP